MPLLPFVWRLALVLLAALALLSQARAQGGQDEAHHLFEAARAYLLAEYGEHEQAAKILAQVAEGRKSAALMASATRAALFARQLQQAKQYARRWQGLGGGAAARQVLAEIHIYSGEWPQAERALRQLMQSKEQSAERLRSQLQMAKNQKTAVVVGERVFPATAEGQFQLAQLAFAATNHAAATAAAARAMRKNPNRADIHFFSALLRQEQHNRANAALPVLQNFVGGGCGGAKNCALHVALAAYYDYLRNKKNWHDALTLKETAHDVWRQRAGLLYEHWDMVKEARAQYEAAGENFFARYGLARLAEQEQGGKAKALKILINTRANKGRHFVLRESQIARLLEQTQGAKAAEERLLAAEKTAPDSFDLLYARALLLENTGRINEALDLLRKITRLHPTNPDGWNALGYTLADHNRELPQAKNYIERALRSSPENPSYLDSLGWVYYRMGHLQAARQFLEKAVSLSDSAEISAHLGEVMWELNHHAEAIRIWKLAIAKDPQNKKLNETVRRYRPF